MSGADLAAAGPAPPPPASLAAEVVRVLVCDDSAVVRSVMERLLRGSGAIRVVAKAGNGQEAVAAVGAGGIDVVVLDVEMPVMDGLTALPLLLAADRAVKILMSSSLTTKGAAVALEALRRGAADFIPKPTSMGAAANDPAYRAELIARVVGLGRQCHQARGHQARDHQGRDYQGRDYQDRDYQGRARRGAGQPSEPAPRAAPPGVALRPAPARPPAVLAIGSSTGGPAALLSLFQALGDRVGVPILLTQHMPATFTAQLAGHIQRLGGATCAEAVHGEALRPGHVHLAPGNRHMTVAGRERGATIALSDDAPENFCRPAVDPMLRGLSAAFPGRVLVLMLTGMGQDGLLGAERVVADGGAVIAQDEASSVVWGMPGAVARAGLCHAVLPLPELPARLLQLIARRGA